MDIEKSDQELELRAKKNKTLKIAIVTVVVNQMYQYLMNPFLENKKAYCERHGYDFIMGGEDYSENKNNPLWIKYRFIQRYLPKYDYIFYSDADVYISNMDFKIQDLIKYYENDTNILVSLDINDDIKYINTSNFLVKNDIWSLVYLENVYNQVIFRKHTLSDQASFSYLYNDMSNENVDNKKHIKILDDNRLFNSIFPIPNIKYTNQLYQRGDFIIHYQKWRAPYLTNLHIKQFIKYNPDYQNNNKLLTLPDEILLTKYQVDQYDSPYTIITFMKGIQELQLLKLLIIVSLDTIVMTGTSFVGARASFWFA